MNEQFVALLQKIKKEEYNFKNLDVQELVQNLLREIGHRDNEIRDGLVYPVLAHLLHDNILEKDQLVSITKDLISQKYLLFDMENDHEQSVLIRSFTLLQLAVLLYVHNRDSLYTPKDIEEILQALLQYGKEEVIVEGYNPEFGWIHTTAHLSDVLKQMVDTKEIQGHQLRWILNLIQVKFSIDNYTYISDEDERMVHVVEAIIKKNLLDQEDITNFITSMGTYEKVPDFPRAYVVYTNIKHLLRSLYFRLLDQEGYKSIVNHIQKVLQEQVTIR